MNDYKNILGVLAVAISIASYVVYFWAMYTGKAKPHAFTWFVWGTLSAIGLGAVWVSGGGSGTWVIAVNMICSYIIAGIGLWQRHVQYDKHDWLALGGAFLAMLLWWVTENALYAVVLISLSDVVGLIPSLRKAYRLPFEENAMTFILGFFYYILSLFALESFSLTTSLYYFTIMVSDLAIISIILLRRRAVLKT